MAKGGIVLEGLYDIFRGEDRIGKAEVRREGLYYRFRCCCDLTGEVMYRITIVCSGKSENLGIPIPDGDCFQLNTRLPVSRFPSGKPEFRAVPRHPRQGLWVPISPETPFDYITRLEHAVAEKRDGQMGILISDEAPQDSDPSPSHPHESQNPQ